MKNYFLLGAILLAGCSGSDYQDDDVGGGVVANTPPSIAGIADHTISANQVSEAIAITVSDDSTISANLQAVISSSDQSLINDQNLVLGSFNNLQAELVIRPETGVTGSAEITVQFTDADNASASRVFNVTVVTQQLSANTLIRSIYANNANSEPTSLEAIEVVQDVDDENQFDDLVDAG